LSRDSDASPNSTSLTNSSSPSSAKVINSVHKDFAQEAATFFKEPTAANFKAAVSLFPKWQYYVHTIVSVSVVLLLVVGLAVGLSIYFGTLKKSSSLIGEAENGGNGTTNLVITEPEKSWVEKNVITFSVLCVVGVIVIAGGVGAFIKRDEIKSCVKPGEEVFKTTEEPEKRKTDSESESAKEVVAKIHAKSGEEDIVGDDAEVDLPDDVNPEPPEAVQIKVFDNPDLIDSIKEAEHLKLLFKLIFDAVKKIENLGKICRLFSSQSLSSMSVLNVTINYVTNEPIEQTNLRIMSECDNFDSLRLVYCKSGAKKAFKPSNELDNNDIGMPKKLAKRMLDHMYATEFIEKQK
jgi:hypothetical protein